MKLLLCFEHIYLDAFWQTWFMIPEFYPGTQHTPFFLAFLRYEQVFFFLMYLILSLFLYIEKLQGINHPMNVGRSDSNLIWIPSLKLMSFKHLFKERVSTLQKRHFLVSISEPNLSRIIRFQKTLIGILSKNVSTVRYVWGMLTNTLVFSW